MAVVFNNATSHTQTSSSTSWSFSHSATGTQRLVIVGIANGLGAGADPPSSVTYGGNSMTSIGSADVSGSNEGNCSLWYLVNPPTGSQTVAITFSTGFNGTAGAVSFTGVDQTTPIGDTATQAQTTFNTSISTNVTTTRIDSMIVDSYIRPSSSTTCGDVPGGSQTQRWGDFTSVMDVHGGGSSRFVTTPGSYSMSWSFGGCSGNKLGQVVAVINSVLYVQDISDTVVIGDTFAFKLTIKQLLTETVNLTDTVSKFLTRAISETLSFIDTVTLIPPVFTSIPDITIRAVLAPFAELTQLAYNQVKLYLTLPILHGEESEEVNFRVYNNFALNTGVRPALNVRLTTFDDVGAVSHTTAKTPVAESWIKVKQTGFGAGTTTPGLFSAVDGSYTAIGRGNTDVYYLERSSDGFSTPRILAGTDGNGVGFAEIKSKVQVPEGQPHNTHSFALSIIYEWVA